MRRKRVASWGTRFLRLGAVLAVALTLQPAAVAAPDGPVPYVGQVVLGTEQGILLAGVDPGLNRLVVVAATEIFLVDAMSLTVTRKIALPFESAGRISLDTARHLAYIPESHGLAPQPEASEAPAVAVVDLSLGKVLGRFRFPDAFRGQFVDATGFFAPERKLYVVTDMVGNFDQSLRRLVVHELDAAKMVDDPANAVVWSYDLDGCNDVPNSGNRFGFIHRGVRERFVYFPCDAGFVGPSNGVVRLNLRPGASPSDTSNFASEFHFFGGGLTDGFVRADSANERVLIFASAAGKQKFFVFDAFRRSWIGSVPLGHGSLGGGGFHPTSGRIYATQQPSGLLVSEGSWVPTPQGVVYPTDTSVTAGNLVFDERTHRLFIPASRTTKEGGLLTDRILVHEDRIPAVEPPTIENPDLRTQNVPEIPGETETSLSGGGAAYGARYIFTGGIQNKHSGGIWPYLLALNNSYSGLFALAGQEQNPPYKPGGGARLFSFGRVSDLFVDDGTASAKAISSDADAVTRGDIAQLRDLMGAVPGSSEPPVKEQTKLLREAIAWPYAEADCVDFGGEKDERDGDESGAMTTCDHVSPAATAMARSFPELGTSPIQIGYAWSKVTATRDAKRGVIIRSEAVARNVDIAGLMSIGEISALGEASAFGRPNTAQSMHAPTLKEVVIRDTAGNELYKCGFGDSSCDLLTFTYAANRFLPTRFRVETPEPEADPRIAETKGGAQAVVAKSSHQFWSDFNSFGEASYEVPALAIFVNDDAYPHIFQFAGVTADAHYTVNRFGGQAPNDPNDGSLGGGLLGGGGGNGLLNPPQPNYPLPPAAPQAGGGPVYYVQRAVQGVSFVMSKPREGLLLAIAWLLAGTPAYLARRRRALASVKEGP